MSSDSSSVLSSTGPSGSSADSPGPGSAAASSTSSPSPVPSSSSSPGSVHPVSPVPSSSSVPLRFSPSHYTNSYNSPSGQHSRSNNNNRNRGRPSRGSDHSSNPPILITPSGGLGDSLSHLSPGSDSSDPQTVPRLTIPNSPGSTGSGPHSAGSGNGSARRGRKSGPHSHTGNRSSNSGPSAGIQQIQHIAPSGQNGAAPGTAQFPAPMGSLPFSMPGVPLPLPIPGQFGGPASPAGGAPMPAPGLPFPYFGSPALSPQNAAQAQALYLQHAQAAQAAAQMDLLRNPQFLAQAQANPAQFQQMQQMLMNQQNQQAQAQAQAQALNYQQFIFAQMMAQQRQIQMQQKFFQPGQQTAKTTNSPAAAPFPAAQQMMPQMFMPGAGAAPNSPNGQPVPTGLRGSFTGTLPLSPNGVAQMPAGSSPKDSVDSLASQLQNASISSPSASSAPIIPALVLTASAGSSSSAAGSVPANSSSNNSSTATSPSTATRSNVSPFFNLSSVPVSSLPNAPSVPFFSIDVECVASGRSHNDRVIAHIALVNQDERVLLNLYVKPKVPVFSYLSALTGLTEEIINKHGIELEDAIKQITDVLPPNCMLVGQNILKDVQWLKLEEGKHYGSMLDLAGIWRVQNPKYKGWTYFSLQHEAKSLLGIDQGATHHAATDAIISIKLYKLYLQLSEDANQMSRAHELLLTTPTEPSFSKKYAEYEGVCQGARQKNGKCACGDVFFY